MLTRLDERQGRAVDNDESSSENLEPCSVDHRRIMSAETTVAAIAVLVSVLSVLVAVSQTRRANAIASRSSESAERAAGASERQTVIQEALSRRSAEPYVWADLRPDDRKGGLLVLVVGNSGPTVATDVVVWFQPPLHDAPLPAHHS